MNSSVALPLDLPELRADAAGGTLVRRTVLPSGLRVLTESVPGAQSATVGFWVGVGSRDEQPVTFGSTHFLEHLLFKGTPTRSALDIAISFDEVGGEHNAMTAKEFTCYYAKVRDRDLPMAVEVIRDMLEHSLLDPVEFETERGVILEELAMAEDDPADVAGERIARAVYGAHPLGRPIGGTPESIRAVDRDAVHRHYRETHVPGSIVVTAAGAVDHDALVAALDGDGAGSPRERRTVEPVVGHGGGREFVHRPTEQANLILGLPGLTVGDGRRSALAVLNAVLGGGMSSRLFQEVRERRGLAYSVYSFASAYSDLGMLGLAAGCSPRNAADVAELMLAQLQGLASDGITEAEHRRAVGQLSGASALALEDSDSRMSRLGRAELSLGEFVDLDESLRRLALVTRDEVRELAAELAAGPLSIAAVGPVDAASFDGLTAAA
ncbi:M16 family metallopeptidase [Arenivirga flava]|uniref:Zinc protease n=1 Tax=Arenivirga flava TaxID=1930060 RepID=A0AA37XAT8_9MICO|nr:pitrilysin family protein [Arenivirga flava]GMA27047.1 putative zinc protease [Arenivirga flava]